MNHDDTRISTIISEGFNTRIGTTTAIDDDTMIDMTMVDDAGTNIEKDESGSPGMSSVRSYKVCNP